MNLSEPPSGVLDPKHPWYSNAQVGERTWRILKLKLTGGKGDDGTQYSSFVNLSDADADILIENLKKDPRGYPQFNQTGGMAGYENLQKYQEWLVDEYLVKPHLESKQIEIQEERKQKVKSFISSPSPIRPGKKISIKSYKVSGLIPKRSVPSKVIESSAKVVGDENIEGTPAVSQEVITSLGRMGFDVEIASNNLDRLIEIIQQDYKDAKEVNRKEVEDYRKRVANRGRIIGRRELGDNKSDLSGLLKKYVGSFFSGVGGSIRALAGFNLLQGIMEGNPAKIIGSLTGITASYLPAIGMAVGGKVAQSLGKRLFTGGRRVPGGAGAFLREARPISRAPRGGGRLALGLGLTAAGIAMGSKIFGGGGEAQAVKDAIAAKPQGGFGADTLMPQDAIEKFDKINDKFEQAVNRLLSGGGGIPQPTIPSGNVGTAGQPGQLDSAGSVIASGVSSRYYDPSLGGTNASGAKTASGEPATASGEPYRANLFTAAAFPPLQSAIPGIGRKAMNVLVEDPKSGKKAVVRVNDTGSGVGDGAWLDFSVAAKDFFGMNASGLKISRIQGNSTPGPIQGAVPRTSQIVPTPPPSRTGALTPPTPSTGPVILPFPARQQSQQQASAAVADNNVVPSIDTTYPENFLALYSKLIYQIV